jgi:phosphoadenosine phosphosulfate reductase
MTIFVEEFSASSHLLPMLLDLDRAQPGGPAVEALEPSLDAAGFAERLADASPPEIVTAAARALPGRLAVVSSFGTESAVLLKFVADVDRSLPVLFLDTLWMFKGTLAYRDTLVERLGLTGVRRVTPSPSALATQDAKNDSAFATATPAAAFAKSSRWPMSSWPSTAG